MVLFPNAHTTEDRAEEAENRYGGTVTTGQQDRFFETTVEEGTAVPASRLPDRPPSVNLRTGELLEQPDVSLRSAERLMEQFVGLAAEAPEFFTRIQAGLWATGLLSIGEKKFPAIAGSPNTDTRNAFAALMEDVISRREAGEDITLQDVLADLDARLTPELLADLGAGGGGGGGSALTDPARLRFFLENAAVNLGLDPDRVVTDDVEKLFVAAIHADQGGFGGAGDVQADPDARAREFIEERFGVQIDRAERVDATRTSQDAFNSAADVISQMVGGV